MAKSLGWYRPEQLILKITLDYSDPLIWRRVEVHSGLTLHDLHCVIQNVFEWDDSHKYQFIVPPQGKLTAKAMRKADHYCLDPDYMIWGLMLRKERQAAEAMVGNIFTPEIKQIIYEYDFGDCWKHLVKLEKRTPGGDQNHIPQCLAGENAAPQDDMGGMYGFYRYIELATDAADPTVATGQSKVEDGENDDEDEEGAMDEETEMAVNWLGKNFDPTHFDLARVNKRLAAAFKPVPKRPRKSRKK